MQLLDKDGLSYFYDKIKLASSDIASSIISTSLSGTDLNTLYGEQYWGKLFHGSGKHNCTNTVNSTQFGLIVLRSANGETTQIYIQGNTTEIYMRYYNGTDWSEWTLISLSFATDEEAMAAYKQYVKWSE